MRISMLEETEETDVGFTITRRFQTNDNISFQGEDAKQGERLIEEGSIIPSWYDRTSCNIWLCKCKSS